MYYVKPETTIIDVEVNDMIATSCICHGHCSCDTNENPHSAINKCQCDRRPKINPNEFEWDD